MHLKLKIFLLLSIILPGLGGPPVGLAAEPASDVAQSPAARTAYASAAALQQQGLMDLAKAEWSALIKSHPEDVLTARARFNLGLCQFQLSEFEEAAKQFALLLEGNPGPELLEQSLASLGIARFNQAQSASESADGVVLYQQAVDDFDRFIEKFPDSSQADSASFYRAKSLVALGDRRATEALGQFAEKHAKSPLRPEALTLLGELWQKEDQLEKAIGAFAQAAQEEDYSGAAYACGQQAYCLYRVEKISQAAERYDHLATTWPDSDLAEPATLSAAKCYLRLGKPKQAATRLENSWRAGDGQVNGEVAHWLVRSLIADEQPAKAAEVADAAIANVSDDWKTQLQLDRGDVYAFAGSEQKALELYSLVANSQPANQRTRQAGYLAAGMALKLNQPQRAIELAEQALEGSGAGTLDANLRDVAGEAQLAAEKPAKAARIFEQLVLDYPADSRRKGWALRQAEAMSEAGQWRQLVEHLQRWTGEFDGVQIPVALLLSAEGRLKLKDSGGAIQDLNQLVSLTPDKALLARALHLRGRELASQQKLNEAADDFKRVLAEFPDQPVATYSRLALAAQMMRSGEYRQVSNILQPFANQGTEGLAGQGNFMHAKSRQQLGEYPSALKLLEISQAPKAELHYVKGLCLIGLKQSDKAAANLRTAAESDPTGTIAAKALFELGWLFREQNNITEADAAFAELAGRYPEAALAAESHYRLGETELAKKEWTAAAEQFALAARNPAASSVVNEQATHLLGWARLKSGNPRSAAEAFDRQLSEFPNGRLAIDGQLLLAETLFLQQKYQESLTAYTESLQAEPVREGLKALSQLHAGQAAGQLGNWERSLALLTAAAESAGENSPQADAIEYERAWALKQLGRLDEARPRFASVADSGDGALSARARFMLGELQFAQADLQGAVRTFFQVAYGYGGREAAEEIHEWQAQSLFEAARCLEELDRDDAAVKLYRELQDRFPDSEKATHAQMRLQREPTR